MPELQKRTVHEITYLPAKHVLVGNDPETGNILVCLGRTDRVPIVATLSPDAAMTMVQELSTSIERGFAAQGAVGHG